MKSSGFKIGPINEENERASSSTRGELPELPRVPGAEVNCV
jgi:hypothetical protein